MALVESTLKSGIKAIIVNMPPVSDANPSAVDAQIDLFAEQLAELLTAYIKTATITVPIIPVQVVPASGTGATVTPVQAPLI
jgi:hypothetical protein